MNLEDIRVLLVEDNPGDARLLREAVRSAGAGRMKLVHVERLSAALDKLREETFDIVLLDLSLPDEDGLATLTRAHAESPGTPIVVLTGLDDEALAVRAVREGAQDYLVKGQVDGNLLVRAMRYATERKRAVEALQRREVHFRSLIENALDLISILNQDSTIRYVSPSHERVLGYRAEELVGQNALNLVHPEDVEPIRQGFRDIGPATALNFRFLHKNGSWRLLEAFGRNLTHVPGVQGVVVNSRDITERQTADEALREANDTLSAVIQTSPLAIYSMDLEGRVRSWNAAAQRVFGWPESEVMGLLLPHASPESEAGLRARLAQARDGHTVSELGMQAPRKDGSLLHVTVWNALLRDADGAVKGLVEVVADVSERKHLEEQLHHSQRMEAVGRLAGGVAHDFNNLLTVITGYSQLLMTRMHRGDPDKDDLEQVIKAADRAGDLTKQLLAFSRRQIVHPKVLDLNVLVTDMDRMLRRVIGEDVELRTVLAPDLKRLRADPGQIEQVIMNLAVNARDAMPSGGNLTIQTANELLDEDYARTHLTRSIGWHVLLSVTDTGEGISPENQARLFEPFFTTKELGKGTGLGLSTSYGIVKQNGGDIWVSSELGVGTTFSIYLPVVEEQPAPVEVRKETPALRGSETILLVEDEDAVRRVVEAMLKKQGYEVLSSGDPHEGIRLGARYPGRIDLLLTDSIMPHMNGRELAAELRRQRPDIKVLYVSGYTDPATAEGDAADPDSSFLQKPFTNEVLALKLREVLNPPPGDRPLSRAEYE